MAIIRPETEMKNSGIEWMGNIPKDWDITKLGNLGEIQTGNTPDKSNSKYYSNENGVLWVKAENLGTIYPIEETSEYITEAGIGLARIFDKNTVFVCCIASIGKCGYSNKRSSCNQQINGISFDKLFWKYGLYMTIAQEEEYLVSANGNVVKILNTNKQKMIKCPVPPLSEQQAIADYLDKTCSKIDEIIAEAKASIDEYKELKQSVIDKAVLHGLCNGMMKDSGNDLIGKIPLSWEMRKLKYVADFNPGITTAYDAQKEVGYVPMNCVKNGYMNPLSARLSDMSTGLTGFQDGDIVIAKVTPCFENGNIAVAENLEQGVAFGSSELFVIRTHSINRRFMLYYLQNSVFKNQCISTMTGTGGLKRVSGYFVNNAYITYPPENEQQVIVNYLDEAVKNMDSLISEKESLINDLEAYKKSLIYEVVTGKRKVV